MNKHEIHNLFKELNGYQWSMSDSIISKTFNNSNSLWTSSVKYSWRQKIDLFINPFTGAGTLLNIVRVCKGGSMRVIVTHELGENALESNIPFSIVMSEIM